MLEVTMLPARQGDALWIRWGEPDEPHQLLVDMGTEEIGERLGARILALPEDRRIFDLLVVTHVDRDHIGGVLTCLADEDAPTIPGLRIDDVWFNGWPQISGVVAGATLEPMGAAQGERLGDWLAARAWNASFGGGAVVRTPGVEPTSIPLAGGMTLTVLGPTPERLLELKPAWVDEVQAAIAKGTLSADHLLEPMGPRVKPDIADRVDLEVLAASVTDTDGSEANGASIVLLLEYHGRRVLLTGDAFGADVVEAIHALRGNATDRFRLDAVKLPHHGSQYNVTPELIGAIDCPRWLLSTDGTVFRHPDPPAIARILLDASPTPAELLFNVPSTFNGWWDDPSWKAAFGYSTAYGTAQDGLTVLLD